MNRNHIIYLIFYISLLIFSYGCQQYSSFETDEYYLKLPSSHNSLPKYKTDTTIFNIEFKKSQYNVSVITKKNKDYVSINACISAELESFLQDKNTKNVITEETKINGNDATIVSGVNIYNNKRNYWAFAVISTDLNKFYIIRIVSENSFLSFNEYYNQKIIHSFHIKK